MTLETKDIFSVEYSARNAEIAHYSNIRSALTSFLITASLAGLNAYYNMSDEAKARSSDLLLDCSRGLLIAALLVCFYFSYRTERSILKQQHLWHWVKNHAALEYPYDKRPCWCNISMRIIADPMNWLLSFAVIYIFFRTF